MFNLKLDIVLLNIILIICTFIYIIINNKQLHDKIIIVKMIIDKSPANKPYKSIKYQMPNNFQ